MDRCPTPANAFASGRQANFDFAFLLTDASTLQEFHVYLSWKFRDRLE